MKQFKTRKKNETQKRLFLTRQLRGKGKENEEKKTIKNLKCDNQKQNERET